MSNEFSRLLDAPTEVGSIMRGIQNYKYNPAGIQRIMLDHLTDLTAGKIDVVDPTNPFVFLLESASVSTANFIIENEVNTRRQYPSAAQTFEDIYIHMSDKDFIDRFASPVTTKFVILVEKEELLSSMIAIGGTTARKLTIPGNTEFKVSDVVFSLQYPVEIIQQSHGGLQIIYNTDEVSPLQTLTSNVVFWEERKSTQTQQTWIYIEVDVQQIKVESYNNAITIAAGFNETFTFTDQYYYARIYNKSVDTSDKWVEIKTTHTDQVYDINTPTAVLKVIDKRLNVVIPQVYLTTSKIRGSLRVDIYETKGELNMILENYVTSAFETNWRNIDKTKDTVYTAPIASFRNIFSYSTKTISGGKNEISFEELRTRVINNSIGSHQLPITNVQIESALANKGYTVTRNVDVVTNRVFLASKAMPKPFDERLITAGSASIETLVTSLKDLQSHTLIKTNNQRTTLVPELIYRNNNGILKVLTEQEINSIVNNNNKEIIASIVTDGKYLYSPFHYVLDSSLDEFEVRPYYLDDPKGLSVSFVSQNTASGYQINTLSYSVVRTKDSFKLRIVTQSNDITKAFAANAVYAQLSFIPNKETSRAFLNAVSTKNAKGEFVFEFTLGTSFDIDADDDIYFNTFKLIDLIERNLGTGLTKDFDLTYCINTGANSAPSNIDAYLSNAHFAGLLPATVTSVTQESIRLFFGYPLKTLWSRSRSALASTPYKTYNTASVKVYQEDVYNIDPVTGAIFSFNAAGDIVYNVKFKAGEQVRDLNGNLVYNYRIGDIVRDVNGNPVPEDNERVMRQMDLMFIDGVYFFATDDASATYRKQMVNTIVGWLTGDITEMSKKLLEQTRLYFYPKTNMGTIRALVDNAVVKDIEASQNFNVRLYVNGTVFNNSLLRNALIKTTISTIDKALLEPVISVSSLIVTLKESYAEDVISVVIDGLGGGDNIQTLTFLNETDRCSLKKRLTALPNESLIVEEDVNITFIKHEVS